MSVIKVNKIESTGTTAGGVAVDSNGHVTVDGVKMPTAGTLSNRNLALNGGMTVSQRGTSHSFAYNGTTTGYSLDRMSFVTANLDSLTCTITQSTDAPAGFSTSLKFTTGTPEAAIDANDIVYIQTLIEAQDLQHLQYGTSSAQTLTLSFYVKSSVTGTYGCTFYQGDAGRNRTATYTINSANTWERKEITITGDTGGTINNDSGAGFQFAWNLATGSDWDSTDATAWGAYVGAKWGYGHAQDGVITAAGATWQVTGVQLEVGEKATDFEHRSYGDELARCQRYYYRHTDGSVANTHGVMSGMWYATASVYGTVHFPTEMRAAPTLQVFTNSNAAAFRCWRPSAYSTSITVGIQNMGRTCGALYFASITPAGVAGYGSWVEINANSGVHISFSAEM